MSAGVSLTKGCIERLLHGNNVDDNLSLTVQVLKVLVGLSKKGGNKYTTTISAPMVDNLVQSNLVKQYSIVNMTKLLVNNTNEGMLVVVAAMEHLVDVADVIGEPSYMKKKESKRLRSPKRADQRKSKVICCNDTRQKFLEMHQSLFTEGCGDKSKAASNFSPELEMEVAVDATLQHCENCNNAPCDWSEYGPNIIQHICNEYLGCFVDSDGNIIDEEDGCDAITNKQLHFMAYTAYVSLKHGYLEKRNRVRIPHCVECGIRCKYPDDDNFYVGFRYADDSNA